MNYFYLIFYLNVIFLEKPSFKQIEKIITMIFFIII